MKARIRTSPASAGIRALHLILSLSLLIVPLSARADPGVTRSILYSFTGGSDGSHPTAGLILGSDGNFYGTTIQPYYGTTTPPYGSTTVGTVFKITPAGSLTTLYTFVDVNGGYPLSPLVQGSDGNFYGATGCLGPGGVGGGSMANCVKPGGTVYQITPAGSLTTLHTFSGGADGVNPQGPLVWGSDGNLYGTTDGGGHTASSNAYGFGTVFKITPAGSLTTLYSFNGAPDGANPEASLIQGRDGNFYGTTINGGADIPSNGCGSVFKITPAGNLTILHSFTCGINFATDGGRPQAPLIQATDGNFYGTTLTANPDLNVLGTIFKITPTGSLSTLYTFTNQDSANSYPFAQVSYGALAQGSDGNFFGTEILINNQNADSSEGAGGVYEVTPTGNFLTRFDFSGVPDGSNPFWGLTVGSDGSYYGTTNLGGKNNLGSVFKVSFQPIPFAPADVSATAGIGKVTLNWSATSGATSYFIRQGTQSGGETVTPIVSGLTGTSAIITGLTNGTKYFFVVTGRNSIADGPPSVEVNATPLSGTAATPSFSPAPGQYSTAQTVSINDATPGVTIYFTTDGSAPTTASAVYTKPFKVAPFQSLILKAIAAAAGYTSSAVASASYTVMPPTAAPTFSPASGTYSSAQTVTINDATPGSVIFYTIDGSTPNGATHNSFKYTVPIPVLSTQTLKANAQANGYAVSPMTTASYTITPNSGGGGSGGGGAASPALLGLLALAAARRRRIAIVSKSVQIH